MNKIILVIVFLSAALFAFDNNRSTIGSNQVTATPDSTQIRAVLKEYAKSIINADSILGSKVFSHAAEVSFIHPRGHEKGWPQIERSIYKFFGDMFSSRDLKTSNVKITVYDNTAWIEFYWTFNATFKHDNMPIQTQGRETQILRKTNGQWRIVHVHYSSMPVTAKKEGF